MIVDRRQFLLTMMGGAAAGCANLHPLPRTDDTSAPDTAPTLEVLPVEGQPGGPVLRLRASRRLAPGGHLAIHRQDPGGSSTTLQTIRLTNKTATNLGNKGLQFVDHSIENPGTYTYRLRLDHPDNSQLWSPLRRVVWREPPPAPTATNAQVIGGSPSPVIELTWGPRDSAAIIFKKLVTSSDSQFQRWKYWGRNARGLAVDRDVRPEAVYAYRTALAIETETFTQFGPASPATYVSMP